MRNEAEAPVAGETARAQDVRHHQHVAWHITERGEEAGHRRTIGSDNVGVGRALAAEHSRNAQRTSPLDDQRQARLHVVLVPGQP